MANTEEQIREAAKFRANFPDEAQFNESGDLVVPDGQSVSTVLAHFLRQSGYECNEPEQHSYYAWRFEVTRKIFRIECIVQNIEPWALLTEAKGGIFKKAERTQLHREVLKALQQALASDNRFSEVVWGTRKELNLI